MEIRKFSPRLHPLVAGAAASVILVSLLGAAAMTGILPSSHANVPTAVITSDQPHSVPRSTAPTTRNQPSHHAAVQQSSTQVASASTLPPQSPVAQQQAQTPPPKQNSPVGIGIGAVIGGLLGNQFGSGDGKTLATIAGAVGGGYVGNEIAKKQAP